MMSGIRGKDTQPELILRRGLFSRGVRFRLHVRSLPGRPDIVIHKYRTAVIVQGCFWHAHQGCRYFRLPKSNRRFWSEKLEGNRNRDLRSYDALRAAGWRCAVVWECAIRADSDATTDSLFRFLSSDKLAIDIHEGKAGDVMAKE